MKTKMLSKLLCFTGCILLAPGLLYAQQSKTFTETFTVNPDVVVEVNTSHTDVIFDTWNKNKIVIEATVEIEDATAEEAENYFKNWSFEAIGNSTKVEVKTSGKHWPYAGSWNGKIDLQAFKDFKVEIPEINIPDIASLLADIPEIPEMPPLPPMRFNFNIDSISQSGNHNYSFIYNGNDYENNSSLSEEEKEEIESWREEMKDWKSRFEERKKEYQNHRKEMLNERQQLREEHQKHRQEQRAALADEIKRAREEARKATIEARNKIQNSRTYRNYSKAQGDQHNLKVKKRIKIKMPKNARLKLNIRHGEVKLAENTRNIKANLSHSVLTAGLVDGKDTHIKSSYAPVLVDLWKYGQLEVNFVEEVLLKKVNSLKLSSNSSEVKIKNLTDNAFIDANLGSIEVSRIDPVFSELDLSLNHTDSMIGLPDGAFGFYFNGIDSEIEIPPAMQVTRNQNYDTILIKGYYKNKGSDKNITINARYSGVAIN